jgi:hypothetical protein
MFRTMQQQFQTTPDKDFISQHPNWELVERASSSIALKNSPRLLQLFRYLCERALRAPHDVISEQQVGVDVFGREPGYNSDGDTIVRTQISQLRKRLMQYFLSEGSEEPFTIEIPIGSYLPVFQPRKEHPRKAKEVHDANAPVAGEKAAASRIRNSIAWVGMIVLALLCGWLAWQNSHLRTERMAAAASHSPYLDHLWKQLFDNNRPTSVVSSDANAMFVSDFMDKPITLDEYRDPGYPNGLLNKWITDPQARSIFGHFMSTYFTASQDNFAVARLTETGDRSKIPTTVVYARNFRWPSQPSNVIFLGHRKANPWVELFDNQLNFTYEWHQDARRGLLRNRKPKADETATYEWNIPANSTYATLSYMPTDEGTALLIGGTDMTAVDAGSRFLCDEDAIHKLHMALGVDLTQKVPYFEALIVARRARNVSYEPQLISVRVLDHATAVSENTH